MLLATAHPCAAQCTTDVQCHNDNNVCTCDRCDNGMCRHTFTIYGNTNCDTAALPNVDDILCALGGFSRFAVCPNADLKPDCTGNGVINIDDILATLAAFSGANPCMCAIGIPCNNDNQCNDGLFCNGVETCVGGFCEQGANPCPGQGCSETGDICTGAVSTVISCQLSSSSVPRGSTVNLSTFVESISSLIAYEVAITITKVSGPGALTVDCPGGVSIDVDRPDFVFGNSGTVFTAVNCIVGRAAAALVSSSVTTVPPKYLADFNMTVSMDSSYCTVYEIAIAPSPVSGLRGPGGSVLSFIPGTVCTLHVTGDSGMDCNNNGIADECEVDCQPNGVADDCELSAGTSLDCNDNDIPDECEAPDCQSNDVPDECDIAGGFSTDCNANGIPDECDIVAGLGTDCQPNGVFDLCEILGGSSQDFNNNGIPDECDAHCAAGCGDNNVCTCDRCLNGVCTHTPRAFGDTNCSGGAVNLDDILCSLSGFANLNSCRNADIAPPCTGNGIINLDDILRVLSAFGGADLCGCP
jgi:hypothetical protein